MRNYSRWIVPLLLALAACSGGRSGSERRDKMSQRQKDSVLSESGLPGAKFVGRAMATSDSEAIRASGVDSVSQ
jgi:hypothetical protein